MAKRCDICAKQPASGNNRSFSLRATRRRFLPNLQRMRLVDRGRSMTIKVCTRCIKTISKEPRVRTPKKPVAA